MTEPLCIKQDGIWLVLPYGQPVTNADGFQASYDTVMLWDAEKQEEFGLFRPAPLPAPPEGQILAGPPTLVDENGRPAQVATYTAAPQPTLADLKAAAQSAVDRQRDARLTGGFTVPASASSALAGQLLQTRDADDKLNWLMSESVYRDAVAAGQGDAMAAQFRNAVNATTTVSNAEGLTVLRAMKAWGTAVMVRSWALKDAIMAAADAAALDAIDITSGWPG